MLGLLPDTTVAAHRAATVFWHRAPQAQDSIIAAQRSLAESVVVKSPLPDPLVPVVQWIFQKPGWLMLGGIVLAAVVGFTLLAVIWKNRKAEGHWLATRDRGVKLLLGGGLAVLLALIAATGFKSYHYMMHDNHFCQGCHIFVPSGVVMQRPDTGTYLLVNALEGKHDTLQCHACHPFNLKTQTLELVAWMTARPDRVPPHGKVPQHICEQCHVQGAAKKTWQRIATTAGHRTHLESDSLKGKIGCLTCHALSAHRFPPTDSTCANQKGCHLTEDVTIKLGKMSGQAEMHCNTCHKFTTDVPLLATRDSAEGALTPTIKQCAKCHAMQEKLVAIGFDEAKDPHGGACGMCHNPHTNIKPQDAIKSCAEAQCHATWRDVSFHSGAAHRRVAENCTLCHAPHAARVDASDCTGCHNAVRKRAPDLPGLKLKPPPPAFDTTKALRRTALAPEIRAPRGKGDAPPDDPPPAALTAGPAVQDSFSHERHKKLRCTTCHDVKSKTNTLTFKPPRGCQICHHQAPAVSQCSVCHRTEELAGTLPETLTVKTAAQDAPTRTRGVAFAHAAHSKVRCQTCHAAAVTLAPPAAVTACRDCHADHHAPGIDCATCHRAETTYKGHVRESHVQCTACHAQATVARLAPTRSFCLACHEPKVDHYRSRECTECHMLASPDAYRPSLSAAP